MHPGDEIVKRLRKVYPDVRLALDFSSPFELLMALILAAQCTDERVNRLTSSLLFRKYPDPAAVLAVPVEELESDIHPTGFYRNKAKSLRECSRQLIDRFGGQVPDRIEDLTSLHGVGRKTANILLGNAFGRDAIGVDTHVGRLAQRLDLSRNTDPDKIEADLCAAIRRKDWTKSCSLLQAHGRKVCHARKPDCANCVLIDLCPSAEAPPPSRRKRG